MNFFQTCTSYSQREAKAGDFDGGNAINTNSKKR
jgi:hypothetical protein